MNTTEQRNELLAANLNPGEKVLWRSTAESFQTLDQTHRQSFIRSAVIAGLITLGFTLLLYFTDMLHDSALAIILLVAVLCAIPCFNIIGDAAKLRKAEYLATTERLIVLQNAIHFAEYSGIPSSRLREFFCHVMIFCEANRLISPTEAGV